MSKIVRSARKVRFAKRPRFAKCPNVVELRFVNNSTMDRWNEWIEENAENQVYYTLRTQISEISDIGVQYVFTVICYAFNNEKDAIHFKLRFG